MPAFHTLQANLGPVNALVHLLAVVAPPLCWCCGAGANPREPLCRSCRAGLQRLGSEPVVLAGCEAWAPLAYEGAARALVRALKYRNAVELAGPMAAQIAANAPADLLRADHTLVPVPLHPARMRRRGFNQAERLASALAVRTSLALCDCLQRRGPATRQVGSNRRERLERPSGAVSLWPGRPVPGRVVLVDDVATTGATLAACAAVLRAAGATRVVAVAFARTPGR